MRRYLAITAVLTLMLVSFAHAGSYTITTTPEQDQALQIMADRIMADRAEAARRSQTKDTQAPMTPRILVEQVLDGYLSTTLVTARRASACAKVTDPLHKQALGCAP